MPRSKFQKAVFGLIMSYSMAIGMELYNVAVKMGVALTPGGFSNLSWAVFTPALKECTFMGALVFVFSNLWGNRLGARFAARHCDPEKDNPYFCRIMRQAGTVAIMCPTMSLTASLLFSVVMGGKPPLELPAIWLGTVLKNFPMAFFWNMYAAAPFTHWLFGLVFKKQLSAPEKAEV